LTPPSHAKMSAGGKWLAVKRKTKTKMRVNIRFTQNAGEKKKSKGVQISENVVREKSRSPKIIPCAIGRGFFGVLGGGNGKKEGLRFGGRVLPGKIGKNKEESQTMPPRKKKKPKKNFLSVGVCAGPEKDDG